MAPTDSLNPTATRQVFISGDMNHRVVRVPQNEVDAGQNKAREVHPGLVYEFEHGHLVIDEKTRQRDAAFFEKWLGQMDYGAKDYAAPDLSAEEWLRAHSSFGIGGGWGFHEIEFKGSDSSPALARITELLIAEDIEALVGLYQDEEQGEARADVLKACAGAIGKLEEQPEAPQPVGPQAPAG